MLKSTSSLKSALLVLIALCLLLSLAGCKQQAELVYFESAAGGFAFSYPENWDVFSDGGVTYISIADVGGALPFAMVRFSAFENGEGLTAAEYWNSGLEGFSTVYESYKILQNKRGVFEKEGVNSAYGAVVEVSMKGETRLDGQPKNADEAANYTVQQLVFEGEGRICVVSYMSSKSNFEIYGTVMDDIKESFGFIKAEGSGAVTDKGLADFNMPVPEGWTLETAQAYYKLTNGNATIVACVYSMETYLSPKQYWEDVYRSTVQMGIDGFKEISATECKMGGVTALDVYYTGLSASGNSYNFRQCIAAKGGQAYIITMTASNGDLEAAVLGYEAVIKEFSFK